MHSAARHAGGSRPGVVNPIRRASVTQKRPGAPVPVPVIELLAIYDSDRSCRLSPDVRCLRVFSPTSVTCTALYSDDLPCVDTRSTGPRLTPVRSDSIRRGLRPFHPVRSTRLRIFTICAHLTPGSRYSLRTPNSIRHLRSLPAIIMYLSGFCVHPRATSRPVVYVYDRANAPLSLSAHLHVHTDPTYRFQYQDTGSRSELGAPMVCVCLKSISWRTNAGHHCRIWHILPETYCYSLAGGPARRATAANHNRSP